METIITDPRTLAKRGKSVDSTALVELGEPVEEATSHVRTDETTGTVLCDRTIRADDRRLCSVLEHLVRNSVEPPAGTFESRTG